MFHIAPVAPEQNDGAGTAQLGIPEAPFLRSGGPLEQFETAHSQTKNITLFSLLEISANELPIQ